MVYNCDTCDKTFTKSRNLKRHISEVHFSAKHWKCSIETCSGKFIRRSNLCSHLEKFHKLSKVQARKLSLQSRQIPAKVTNSAYSDITDDDSEFDLAAELEELMDNYPVNEERDIIVQELIDQLSQEKSDTGETEDMLIENSNDNKDDAKEENCAKDITENMREQENGDNKMYVKVNTEDVTDSIKETESVSDDVSKERSCDLESVSDVTSESCEKEMVPDEVTDDNDVESVRDDDDVTGENCEKIVDDDVVSESYEYESVTDDVTSESYEYESVTDEENVQSGTTEHDPIIIDDQDNTAVAGCEIKTVYQFTSCTVMKKLTYINGNLVDIFHTVEKDYFEVEKTPF